MFILYKSTHAFDSVPFCDSISWQSHFLEFMQSLFKFICFLYLVTSYSFFSSICSWCKVQICCLVVFVVEGLIRCHAVLMLSEMWMIPRSCGNLLFALKISGLLTIEEKNTLSSSFWTNRFVCLIFYVTMVVDPCVWTIYSYVPNQHDFSVNFL
jgi:hypothetical protein